MLQGGFELRDWESTECETEHGWETPVLGMKWNRQLDSLRVNMSWMNKLSLEQITKRIMLSAAHKVFDPIGYTAQVMLCPKLMLQKAWKMPMGWDTEITGNLRKEFLQWFQDLKILEEIHISRWINVTAENLKHCTIHTFCDASKEAYAAVVFLRLEEEGSVKLSLLAAKSRIVPLRGGTIPRMELLAALVGARLTNSVIEALNWKEVKCYYWSDSTTVLAWISREENWSVFVRNRVQEIRKQTSPLAWNHVVGELNPANLSSRGYTATQLMSLRWWEGPKWLTGLSDFWRHGNILNEDTDEDEIEKEKLKSMKSLANTENIIQCNRIYSFFSKYQQIVRLRLEVDTGPLPENRVRDAAVFQITGVDAARPLFLRGNQKAWVLLFTCAVYRAVHLEIITSLSTEAFLMGFRRFVARRGRCSTIYCDNGTNFIGAANLLHGLDWNKIIRHGAINAIEWKFNPPTAAWWGDIKEWSTPDIDVIDHNSLNRRLKYRQNLPKDLRNRFRNEYLVLLVQRTKCRYTRKLAVGDVVLVGADNCKRINWPLGRVTDIIPGKDEIVRLVKIQTPHSKLLRPVQRVHPLEISSVSDFLPPMRVNHTVGIDSDDKETFAECERKFSRSGREIKVPEKLDL
ncbi:hypothetical protein AVEN_146999-1 [Araneus ventricosus]|uniref:DUF5641 domain-containing protein n=1 Tax=Araneus ventricosus TaxID=182803 RepID=A0A4Y2EKM4_ARAVE|nr:hypothetical protein AVEN_30466-1 [Araneus ventricosus]GBM28894.1 hypothetical protein AVEN_146999-1 [Araneus ventricosus]